ncbi:hypothetical protein BKA81DRAFT_370023, partial [Phyllosticta paracitricarpa]
MTRSKFERKKMQQKKLGKTYFSHSHRGCQKKSIPLGAEVVQTDHQPPESSRSNERQRPAFGQIAINAHYSRHPHHHLQPTAPTTIPSSFVRFSLQKAKATLSRSQASHRRRPPGAQGTLDAASARSAAAAGKQASTI